MFGGFFLAASLGFLGGIVVLYRIITSARTALNIPGKILFVLGGLAPILLALTLVVAILDPASPALYIVSMVWGFCGGMVLMILITFTSPGVDQRLE